MAIRSSCLRGGRASVVVLLLVIALSAAGLAPGFQSQAFAANSASTTLVGDVDGDCRVSVLDLTLIAAGFGYSFGSLLYIPAYDLNHNGAIDIFDIALAGAHFGQHC